jgi:hypothetical protein
MPVRRCRSRFSRHITQASYGRSEIEALEPRVLMDAAYAFRPLVEQFHRS